MINCSSIYCRGIEKSAGNKAMVNFRIDNKIALVTGCNSGIGMEIAIELAHSGACVFLFFPAFDYLNGTIITVDGGWMAR